MMNHPKFTRSKSIGSLLLPAIVTVALSLAPVAFGQGGKGASADDWFLKPAEDKNEKLQKGIGGGESRDVIPSLCLIGKPVNERIKPPSPDYLLGKVKWGRGEVIDKALTEDWNLAPYIVGYGRVGEAEGKAEMFGALDQNTPTSEFVFAQVKHDGSWNAHPGAARQLLSRLEKDSAIPVNLKRVSVDLNRDDTSAYPFLFFTGLDDFVLTNKQIEALRKHVDQGGTLVVNNALGLATFHQAAVREMRRVFPADDFRLLPQSHEIYRSLNTIESVKFTAALKKGQGEKLQGRPVLFGAEIKGKLRVIYSPYDIEGGWNEVRYPLSRGYQSESAKQLGCNIIMFAMTK